MKRMQTLLVLVVTVCVIPCSAQIVNIENQRMEKNQGGWSGSVGLDLNYTQNTKEIWQVGSHFRIQYRKKKHMVQWLSELNFVKAGEDDFVNNGYEHLRYNYRVSDSSDRIILEAFRQTQYNRVQKIRLRSLFGGGVRINLLAQDSAQVVVGLTPMLEFEELTTGISNQHVRLSSYFSFDFQFSTSIGLNSITYYQPDILNWDDYRLSNETTLRFKVTRALSFQMTYNLTYDENPPEGIPNAINIVRNGLKFKF